MSTKYVVQLDNSNPPGISNVFWFAIITLDGEWVCTIRAGSREDAKDFARILVRGFGATRVLFKRPPQKKGD